MAGYALFLDAGYLTIGDPSGVKYKDPATIGAGAGKFFYGGTVSVLFYYQQYTHILHGFQSPKQFSINTFYQLNPRLLLNSSLLLGLSEVSPDFSLSMGFELGL